MSFNIGLSGLYAANKALNVTGNNIANVATTGFKSSRAEFADQYSNSIRGTSAGKNVVGTGVKTAAVSQMFSPGNINGTGQALDMAIDGNGFFVMSDNGSKIYTRAGAFYSDKDGYVVNSSGANLQGYAVDANGKIIQGML
ncbi:flagellar hook-basal body complex protein, partial [Corallococcus exiguus]|nr:flagellar hook-basal body complex protein [Corallococcus exiguus]